LSKHIFSILWEDLVARRITTKEILEFSMDSVARSAKLTGRIENPYSLMIS
jgi:hypothetical protein